MPSARRTATVRVGTFAEAASDELSVLGFKNSQGGVEQFALWYNDQIVPRRNLVPTENLSYQSFSPVARNGASELPGCRDAQPASASTILQQENRRVSARHAHATVVHLAEIRPTPDTL